MAALYNDPKVRTVIFHVVMYIGIVFNSIWILPNTQQQLASLVLTNSLAISWRDNSLYISRCR